MNKNPAYRHSLSSDSFGDEEIEAAISVLKSGRYTMGKRVAQFEKEFAARVGMKHAIMVNSGSSANLIAIAALMNPYYPEGKRLSPGDEVFVPALAWPTTVWPLVQLGLVPVYVDIDSDTLAISLDSAKKNLSPKTKGMFLIHVLGQAAPMDTYTAFCKEHGLVLIEDCCESFGAFFDGTHVGNFGDVATFSHYFSHHLTTIEGGTVTTNNDQLADDLRTQRSHGWIRDRSDRAQIVEENPDIDHRFLFITTGYNVRPTDIQGAIGSVQLKRADALLAGRDSFARALVAFAEQYTPWMTVVGAKYVTSPIGTRSARCHSWMSIPFILSESAPKSVQEVKEIFESCGVETRPIIAGNLARHPATKRIHARIAADLSTCDNALSRGFMIGCHDDAKPESLAAIEEAFKAIA